MSAHARPTRARPVFASPGPAAALAARGGGSSLAPARPRRSPRSPAWARALLPVIAWLAAACATAPPAAPPEATVRVVTYNIHAGKDAAGVPNLERVAAFLGSVDADVVLLQEVDRGTERSGRVDQLAELERLTGLDGTFGKSLDYQGGEYGIAVLSRWPAAAARVVPLAVDPPQERAGGSYEPRVLLHVELATPTGPLHVVNTHLDPSRTGTWRRQEMVGLLAHIRRAVPPDAPLIVGGDLNARPDADVIAALGLALRDGWVECGSGVGATFPAAEPDRRIDYLFLRSGRCRDAWVPADQASDHRPLVLVFTLP